jgi:hypothetical protein
MAIPVQSRRLDHPREAAESPPPGALETFATAARAPDDDEMAQARREEALRTANDGVIGELAKRGISDPGFRRNVIWRDVPVYDEDAIWKGVQQARQQDQHAFPELPATLDAYRQQVAAPFDQEMAARHARLDRGGGIAKLAGGLNSGLSDPAQLPFMMIGAGEARSVAGAILQGAKTNAQIAAYQQPLVALQHAKYGEQLSTSEAAQNIGAAALLGGVLSGAGQAVSNARGVHPVPDAQLPDHVEATVGRANMTADERAAADVLRREQEIDAASPYMANGAGDAAHRAQLDDAVRSVLANTPQPSTRARLMSGTAPGAVARPAITMADAPTIDRVFNSLIIQESGGRAGIPGPATKYGTAHGMSQMLDGTGAEVARQLGLEWRPDLMRAATPEAAAYQRQLGRAYFEEGLQRYGGDVRKALMFYHGGPNEKLWGSKTHAYADAVLARSGGGSPMVDMAASGGGAAAGARPVLDGPTQGASDAATTPGDLIAAAGQQAPVGPAPQLADPHAVPPLTLAQVPTSQVSVDAGLMQFKAGGDANGVTDRLQGVDQWNPLLAGRQMLWERRDGTLLVADGHQRVGLARRIGARTGEDIPLDAVILREADGVTAAHARILAALKNISEGTVTALDAAKVLRDAGPEALRMLPPRSALVRDGAGLAHLSPEAFGAVVNDVIKPEHGAAIGRLLPDDPEAHMAMVDLLAKTKPANRLQAESIIRQGIAAGFTDGVQTDMFGSLDTMASLFLERAKVLDGAIGQLRKLKNVFKVAGREADTLETGGVGTIDAGRAAQEASHNATAIDLVERLASARGPIKDAIDAAARRLSEGGKQSAVVDQLVKDIRGIDLRAALLDGDRAAQSEATRSGEGFGGEPAPQLVDEQTLSLFGDPHGAPAAIVTESLEHDLRAAGHISPPQMSGEKVTMSEGDRLGFRMDEEGATIDRAQLVKEIDAENAAIEAVKKCL